MQKKLTLETMRNEPFKSNLTILRSFVDICKVSSCCSENCDCGANIQSGHKLSHVRTQATPLQPLHYKCGMVCQDQKDTQKKKGQNNARISSNFYALAA
jgi:hypothetical protein